MAGESSKLYWGMLGSYLSHKVISVVLQINIAEHMPGHCGISVQGLGQRQGALPSVRWMWRGVCREAREAVTSCFRHLN
jgi:hypothetical protein